MSAPAVRFYEREGLLTPPRRSEEGYRPYPVEALGELRFIARAKTLGLSLDQIRVLRSQPDAEAGRRQLRHLVAHQLVRTRRQIAEPQAMEDALAGLFGALAHPRAGSARQVLPLIADGIGRGLAVSWRLLWESLYGLTLGFLMSAAVQVLVPQRLLRRYACGSLRGIAAASPGSP